MAKPSRSDRRARVEAMRREQQRKERRSSFLIYGTGGFLAVAVLLAAVIPSVLQARSRTEQRSVGYVKAAASTATAAGCTGVRNDVQISRDHTAATVDYAKLLTEKGEQVPPSSGPHNPNPFPEAIRFYPRAEKPKVERAVHNLEHGFVIAWYDSALPQDQVTKLQEVANQAGQRFIAVPWDRGVFPDGRHVVLTAWDRTQRCNAVDPAVVASFIKTYSDPSTGENWPSPTAGESGGSGGSMSADASGDAAASGTGMPGAAIPPATAPKATAVPKASTPAAPGSAAR